MNRKLCETLLGLQRRDLDMRDWLLREGRLYGDYADEMQAVHIANARQLDAIIDRHGWPGEAAILYRLWELSDQ